MLLLILGPRFLILAGLARPRLHQLVQSRVGLVHFLLNRHFVSHFRGVMVNRPIAAWLEFDSFFTDFEPPNLRETLMEVPSVASSNWGCPIFEAST